MPEEQNYKFVTPPATLIESDSKASDDSSGSHQQRSAQTEITPEAETTQSHSPSSLIGKTIGEHYLIESIIGEGGISVVYKAMHTLLGTTVALKFLLPGTELNGNALMRFQREAQSMAELNHQSIANIKEFGIHQAIPYLVIEFVEGENLADIIAANGKLEPRLALSLLQQIVEALSYAHEHKIVHRDLKPSNIMVRKNKDGSQTAKIIDFGIAKSIEGDEQRNLTKTGDVFGTPAYMSPEQCQGAKADYRSDIYSVGCIAYEMFSGKAPFTGTRPLEVIMKHVNAKHKSLKQKGDLNGLNKVLDAALAKEPKNRYQTCNELLADLKLLAEGKDPVGKRSASKHISFVKIMMSMTALLFGVLVLYVWFIYTFHAGTVESVTTEITKDPSATNYYLRARLLRDAGRDKEALADTAKSLELQPDNNFWAHKIRSDVFNNMGDYQNGLMEGRLAVYANPKEYRGYMCIALAMYHLGHYKEAIEKMTKSLELNHDPNLPNIGDNRSMSRYYRAASLNKLGEYEKALKDLDEAIRAPAQVIEAAQDTFHIMLLVERARANLGLKNFDEALKDAQTACDDDPSAQNAKKILQQVRTEMKNYVKPSK